MQAVCKQVPFYVQAMSDASARTIRFCNVWHLGAPPKFPFYNIKRDDTANCGPKQTSRLRDMTLEFYPGALSIPLQTSSHRHANPFPPLAAQEVPANLRSQLNVKLGLAPV